MADDLLLFAAQETVLISLHAYFSLCYSFFFSWKAYFGREFSAKVIFFGCISLLVAKLTDWLKNPAPGFQPMRCKTKANRTNRTLYARIDPAVLTSNR